MSQRHCIEGLPGVYLHTTQETSPTVGLVYELECDRLIRVQFTLDFEVTACVACIIRSRLETSAKEHRHRINMSNTFYEASFVAYDNSEIMFAL